VSRSGARVSRRERRGGARGKRPIVRRSSADLLRPRWLNREAVRRARLQLVVLLPLVTVMLALYADRDRLFGGEWGTVARILFALTFLSLGWHVARDIGRALGPLLFRRLDPPTAGTAGFLIRLVTMMVVAVVGLRIAGLGPRTVAFGGAVTAVVVGLAAQQTLGNLIAGMVLLSARPFRVGERVRLQSGGLAGSVDGDVVSLGLLYTTLADGDDLIMVPNSIVLGAGVVPLREPASVDVRVHLRPGVTPVDVEQYLDDAVSIPMRGPPRITLEELEGDEVVVRVSATPADPNAGARLATEVLEAVGPHTAGTGAAAHE
jgi:small conductance mechanosensitive channel